MKRNYRQMMAVLSTAILVTICNHGWATSSWFYAVPSGQSVEGSPAIGPDGTVYVTTVGITSDEGDLDSFKLGNNGLSLNWSRSLNNDSGTPLSSPTIGSDGTIYVASTGYIGNNTYPELYAVNPTTSDATVLAALGTETGAEGSSGNTLGTPAIGPQGTIYVTADDNNDALFAIEANGAAKWAPISNAGYEGREGHSSSVVGPDGTIYYFTEGGTLNAVDKQTGAIKWECQYLPPDSGNLSYGGNDLFAPSLAIGEDGTIYVTADYNVTDSSGFNSTNFGALFAVTPTGSLKWERSILQTPIGYWYAPSAPAIGPDGTIYFGNQDSLYAYNRFGEQLWAKQTPDGGRIYATPLVCTTPNGNTVIYAGDEGGGLNMSAASANSPLTSIFQESNGAIESSPAMDENGTIYFGTDNGYLYAVSTTNRLADSPWPMLCANVRHTGRQGVDVPRLVVWGDNSYGQTNLPSGLTNVVSMAAGLYFDLALKADGTVTAWGNNTYGETNLPAGLDNVAAISAGWWHSLALKTDGTLVAWGYNPYGETNIPAGLSNVVAIAAGGFHNLALTTNGTVVAWGDNTYGQCNVPSGLSDVVAIAGGWTHSLALKADGTVVAWGNNQYGQCNVPSGLSDVVAIAAGAFHSLALKADGTVVAWGNNSYGQCNVPAGLSDVVAIAAGTVHNLALKADGTVVAWGANAQGQTNVPTSLTNVVAIAAGGYSSLALGNLPPVDFTFNPSVNGTIYGMAVQTNGQILIAGTFSQVDGQSCYDVARLNADGTLDSPFTAKASVVAQTYLSNPNYSSGAYCIGVDTEGNVYVGGSGSPQLGNASNVSSGYLFRLTSDGSLDSSFNPTEFIGYYAYIQTLYLYPYGQWNDIEVCGSFTNYDGESSDYCYSSNQNQPIDGNAALFMGNGSPDGMAFNVDGQVFSCIPLSDGFAFGGYFDAINGQSSPTCLAAFVGGATFDASTLVNLGSDGSMVWGLATQSNGQIVAAGEFGVERFNSNGSVDTTFAPDFDYADYCLLVEPNDKILVGGSLQPYSSSGLGRLNADGSWDSTFNMDVNGGVNCLVRQPDGSVLAGGQFNTVNGQTHENLVRFNPND